MLFLQLVCPQLVSVLKSISYQYLSIPINHYNLSCIINSMRKQAKHTKLFNVILICETLWRILFLQRTTRGVESIR